MGYSHLLNEINFEYLQCLFRWTPRIPWMQLPNPSSKSQRLSLLIAPEARRSVDLYDNLKQPEGWASWAGKGKLTGKPSTRMDCGMSCRASKKTWRKDAKRYIGAADERHVSPCNRTTSISCYYDVWYKFKCAPECINWRCICWFRVTVAFLKCSSPLMTLKV